MEAVRVGDSEELCVLETDRVGDSEELCVLVAVWVLVAVGVADIEEL